MARYLKQRDLEWMGDSQDNIRSFPKDVTYKIGVALRAAQDGNTHQRAKPFKGVGSGVFEIVANSRDGTYRAVYAVKIGEKIYVLHAFQKKSKKGIKTPQREIDLINSRYQEAVETERRSNQK